MSDTAPPILCVYQGGVFKPARTSAELRASKYYREGVEYELVEQHQRSQKSHNHYFAAVAEAFRNLPEVYAQEFDNDDHLRKWALIRTGYCTREELVCDSAEAAERVAAFARKIDAYAVIQVEGNVIRRFVAKSQRHNAMDHAEFQRSKDAVLDLLSTIVGTTRKALEHAGAAA